jgi:vacuolar-type H+-ATPase subunit E/Vma4
MAKREKPDSARVKSSRVNSSRVDPSRLKENGAGNSEDMAVLLSAIKSEAAQEAEKIISQARQEDQRKRQYAERQVESILNEAKTRAQKRSEQIRQHVLSGVAIEVKRRIMKIQEEIYRDVLQRAERRIHERALQKDFYQVLFNHVVEAAIGLDAPSARVNATEREREMISERFLREAEMKVESLTGKSAKLSLSEEAPLRKLGVVLTAEDNRTAFDNRIDTRRVRKSTEIRQYIYDKLFHTG